MGVQASHDPQFDLIVGDLPEATMRWPGLGSSTDNLLSVRPNTV